MPIITVLEFYPACWAVCDSHGLCSGEYLFSELFVFSGACSAHRSSSFLLFSLLFVLVLGGGASQRQRDERRHRLTLPSLLLLLSPLLSSPRLSFSLLFLVLWVGLCRVVRAQPREHARNTTQAFVCSGFVYLLIACVVCHDSIIVVPTTHRSLLTITTLTIEH